MRPHILKMFCEGFNLAMRQQLPHGEAGNSDAPSPAASQIVYVVQ